MHGLIPRHRRKAGSGPPATALIAWIGTDPHLRSVTAAANHQRDTDPPLAADSRSAKAAVATCFVLACGAVLGITAAINDGLVVPLVPRESTPPAMLGQSPAGEVGPGMSPVPPEQGGPGTLVTPAPVGIDPMIVNRQKPQTGAVPGANGDPVAAANSDRPASSGAPTPAASTNSQRRAARPDNSDKPTGAAKPDTVKPSGPGAPVDNSTPVSSGPPGNTDESKSSGSPNHNPAPGNSDSPVDRPAPSGTDKPTVLSKLTKSPEPPGFSTPDNPDKIGEPQNPTVTGGSGGKGGAELTGKSIGSRRGGNAGTGRGASNLTADKPAPSTRMPGTHRRSSSARGSASAGKSTSKDGSGRGSASSSGAGFSNRE